MTYEMIICDGVDTFFRGKSRAFRMYIGSQMELKQTSLYCWLITIGAYRLTVRAGHSELAAVQFLKHIRSYSFC